MNSKVVPLLISLVVLVAINLAVTSYLVFRPQPVASVGGSIVDEPLVSEKSVAPLATKMVALFNAKDGAGIHALFDDLAKAQISQAQISEQLEKLHSLMGKIDTLAYDRAELAGTDAGRTFYNIHYKVSLAGGSFNHGTLKLTVVRRGDQLRLFGFFVNGADGASSR